MGIAMVFQHAPNGVPIKETTKTANTWLLLGLSGAGYTSLAALQAAQDAVYPSQHTQNNLYYPWSVEPGTFFQTLTVWSDGGGGTMGSAFYIAVNASAYLAPTTTAQGRLVNPGSTFVENGTPRAIWYLKTVANDSIIFQPAY